MTVITNMHRLLMDLDRWQTPAQEAGITKKASYHT